jgi:hypothetical protein
MAKDPYPQYESTASDDPSLLGISVLALRTVFLEDVKTAGLTEESTIYEIENLRGPPGVIRRKGEAEVCPITKKLVAAYVHCLHRYHVGRATHMLSYMWGYVD